MSRFLVSAKGELEVVTIRDRLSEAGIPVVVQSSLEDVGVPLASSRDIYVNDEDLERAKTVLAEGADFSDDELAALSQRAFQEATESPTRPTQPKGIDTKTGKPYEPAETPVPKVGTIRAAIRKVAQTKKHSRHA